MAVVTYTLGTTAIIDELTIILAVLYAIALFRFRFNPIWLILAGGGIGLIKQWFI